MPPSTFHVGLPYRPEPSLPEGDLGSDPYAAKWEPGLGGRPDSTHAVAS